MAPRQMPLKWALWGWRRRQETLTFEANLTCPPRLSVEIGRTRCTGLTRRWMRNTGDWPTHTVATLFISNQPEWEPEISGRMSSVVSTPRVRVSRKYRFRPRPPQFSVTFSLKRRCSIRVANWLFSIVFANSPKALPPQGCRVVREHKKSRCPEASAIVCY